jgi:hypothetical protein
LHTSIVLAFAHTKSCVSVGRPSTAFVEWPLVLVIGKTRPERFAEALRVEEKKGVCAKASTKTNLGMGTARRLSYGVNVNHALVWPVLLRGIPTIRTIVKSFTFRNIGKSHIVITRGVYHLYLIYFHISYCTYISHLNYLKLPCVVYRIGRLELTVCKTFLRLQHIEKSSGNLDRILNIFICAWNFRF